MKSKWRIRIQALSFQTHWFYTSKLWNSDPVFPNNLILRILTFFFQLILELWPYSSKHWNCDLILPNIGILPLFLPNTGIVPFFFQYWNSNLILPNTWIMTIFSNNIWILTLFFQTLELWPTCNYNPFKHLECCLILPNIGILNNAQRRSWLLSFICRLLITYDKTKACKHLTFTENMHISYQPNPMPYQAQNVLQIIIIILFPP